MNPPALRLLRLVQHQVLVGKPLPFGVRDEQGKLLLARGHVIADDAQLQVLLDRGAYVDAEELRALKAAGKTDPAQAKVTLFTLWEQAIWRVERLLRSTAEADFPQRTQELATAFVALVERDTDIGIYLAMRQDEKRLSIYGLSHALYTALVCCLMARRMAWSDDDLLRLVKAALTMNQPIFELQSRLATQGNKPTQAQYDLLRAHPQACADTLTAAGVADGLWLAAVAQHHERRDGSGYPLGITEPAELAVMLGHADVFMAKISPRTGRPPLSIQEAERRLFADEGGGPMATAVIKEFGIYPPGDFVQLKSGEMAVVVRRGMTAHTPIAAAITNRAGVPVVDTVRRDTAKPEFAITGSARDKKLVLRVPPERLFGLAQ